MKNLILYFNTLRYLKPVQIYGRIFSLIKKKFPRRLKIEYIPEAAPISAKADFIYHDPWNDADNILKGRFTFLNKSAETGFPPKWDYKADTLWQFNLHYFAYL